MAEKGAISAGEAKDFTADALRRFGLLMSQPRRGYRFSLDPLLLCDFCGIAAGEKFIDLGTGCGIIPAVLVRSASGVCGVGVDHQREMAELALQNVSENRLQDAVTVFHRDVLDLRKEFPVSHFDLVVANPPFRVPGEGRVSPKAGRDLARHESTASMADFLAAAKFLVKPSGRICFIYLAARLSEFLAAAASLKLHPLRLRMVHGTPDADAKMFLVELAKGRRKELRILPPLVVRAADGRYTAEAAEILGEESSASPRETGSR